MIDPIRAHEIINTAFSKFNVNGDKVLYTEILTGIISVEKNLDIKFSKSELISIIKIMYKLFTDQIVPLSLKHLDVELQRRIVFISSIICSCRMQVALNVSTLLSSQVAEEVLDAE